MVVTSVVLHCKIAWGRCFAIKIKEQQSKPQKKQWITKCWYVRASITISELKNRNSQTKGKGKFVGNCSIKVTLEEYGVVWLGKRLGFRREEPKLEFRRDRPPRLVDGGFCLLYLMISSRDMSSAVAIVEESCRLR